MMASTPPYVSLDQRDVDPENNQESRLGENEQIRTVSLSASSPHQEPMNKYRLDIIEMVASAATILTASACVALAVRFSKKEYTESNLSDMQYVSNLDCSVIQSDKDYFAGALFYAVSGQVLTSTPDPGTVNQVERTFMLDLKTAPRLSFVQVKVLDVMWNLIAGQGIRLIMGYITYVICAYWFMTFIVRSRLSYNFYTVISFQGITLLSTYEALKEFFRLAFNSRFRKGWSWLTIMLWMVFSMTYVISIPSLLNAASGYMVPSKTRWTMPNGDLVSDFEDAFQACWLVKNDSRIGFDKDTIISGPPFKQFRLDLFKVQQNGNSPDRWREITTNFPRFDEITLYYGQIHDILNSTWAAAEKRFNISHASRRSNETDLLLNYSSSLFSQFTTNITIKDHEYQIPAPPMTLDISPRMMAFWRNETSNVPYFRGIQPCYKDEIIRVDFNPPLFCVSASDGYAWGFSKQFLAGILSTHAVWCIATWSIWLFVRREARKLGQKKPGPYLTALVLADSIRGDLDGEVDGLSETELGKKLEKSDGVKSRKSEVDEIGWMLTSRRPHNSSV